MSEHGLGTPGVELRQYLIVLREAAGLELAVNHFAVDCYIKNTAPPFDQLTIDAVFCLDAGRQTGGLGQVVSLDAVLDADFHLLSPGF